MSDTFIHKFGGWYKAEVRRWRNPDGGEGGIVATSASVHESVTISVLTEVLPSAWIGQGASIGDRASIGHGASIGNGASIGDGASICTGAWIGTEASIGNRASIGQGASIGDRVSIGQGASIGNGASIEADDWFFVAGPQGSRNAWATAVWSRAHGLRWWVGCQHGLTTDQLRKRVAEDHGISPHGADYIHLIAMVETHPGLSRAMAAHAAKQAAE